MPNVQRTSRLPIFAAVELAVYLRSAVTALLAVAAVFIAARRLAGALDTPLRPFLLLLTAGLLAGLSRLAHARGAGSVLISLSVLIIAASLSLAGSHPVALLGFWAVIVGQEFWAWRDMLPVKRSISPLPLGEGVGDVPSRDPHPGESDSLEDPESTAPAADVLQQLTLRTTAEGGQELSGWLRMPLAAGQRTGSLHVAFCPAFGQAPQIEVEPVGGPDCRIKAAQALPYGARLDVKLDQPAQANENVLVWLHAAVPRICP